MKDIVALNDEMNMTDTWRTLSCELEIYCNTNMR